MSKLTPDALQRLLGLSADAQTAVAVLDAYRQGLADGLGLPAGVQIQVDPRTGEVVVDTPLDVPSEHTSSLPRIDEDGIGPQETSDLSPTPEFVPPR
jgi:hypothetical protein